MRRRDHARGTLLSGEDDLGLDDRSNQGRMEFNMRMARAQQPAPRLLQAQPLQRGDRSRTPSASVISGFDAGDDSAPSSTGACFRSRYTYSFIKAERFEGGPRARHLTLSIRRPRAVSPARTIAKETPKSASSRRSTVIASYRISKRWAVNVRARSRSHAVAGRRSTARWPNTTPTCSFAGARISRSASATPSSRSISRCSTTDEPLLFNLDSQRPGSFLPRELLGARAHSPQEIPPRARSSPASRSAPLCPEPVGAPQRRVRNRGRERRALRERRDVVFLVVHHQHRDAHAAAPRPRRRSPRPAGRNAS